MIDVSLVVLATVMAYLGWRRGLVRTLTELSAVTLAMLLSNQIAGAATPAIINNSLRPATHQAIEAQAAQLDLGSLTSLGQLELEKVLEGIPSEFIREQAKNLLEGLTPSLEDAQGAAKDALVDAACQAADTVLDKAVYSVVLSALRTVTFIVLLSVFRIIARTLNLFAKLPVVKQANKFGGLLLGLCKGLLLVLVISWAVCALGFFDQETVEGTCILKTFGNLFSSGSL